VEFKRKRSKVESRTPFSCDRFWFDDWIKCMDCLASDSLFERAVSAQSPYKQGQKRNREEKKTKIEEIFKKTMIATPERKSPVEEELINWMKAIEKCTIPQLKSLCKANKLMVSGTKSEVIVRLTRCKRHGGPGACPVCKNTKLKFDYPSDDIMVLPCNVSCNHTRGNPIHMYN
jgi:hypothetical protein